MFTSNPLNPTNPMNLINPLSLWCQVGACANSVVQPAYREGTQASAVVAHVEPSAISASGVLLAVFIVIIVASAVTYFVTRD